MLERTPSEQSKQSSVIPRGTDATAPAVLQQLYGNTWRKNLLLRTNTHDCVFISEVPCIYTAFKHHAMKMYRKVGVKLHAFLISVVSFPLRLL